MLALVSGDSTDLRMHKQAYGGYCGSLVGWHSELLMREPAVSFDYVLLYLCTYIHMYVHTFIHTYCNAVLFVCVRCMTILCIVNNGDTCSIL